MSIYSYNDNTKKDFGSLIKNIKNTLETHLNKYVSGMFTAADEKIFELANSSLSNKEQSRYFEFMRILRENKQELSSDFLSNTNLLLRPFSENETARKQSSLNSMDELSLVGQDEMEVMVLIKSISGNVSGKFHEALSQLEARLKHLATKTPDIFSKKALDPINICQAFDDALGDHFDIKNKKLLLQFFEDHVASKLGATYDTINNLLIEAGVLPQIKLHARKSPSKYRPAPSSEQQYDEDGDYTEHNQPINQAGYAMTATPGHASQTGSRTGTSTGTGGNTNTTPGSASQQGGTQGAYTGSGGGSNGGSAGGFDRGVNTNRGGGDGATESGATGSGDAESSSNTSSGTADNGASHSGNYQHNTAGMPASHVSDVIGEYMGTPLAPPLNEGGASESYPATNQQYYGHDDVLTALSSIQIQPEFSSTGELKFDAEAIKQAVLAQIAKTSGGVVTKRINRIAEKTIDFIELIFDAIIEDEDISDTIKALLLRLQIPVIKASMVDQEFFIYDTHPARVLLDRITEVGIGVSDHTDEVYILLDKTITKLVNEFELQTSSFQAALDDIDQFINERDELAREKEEESQRQVLRGHARSTVLQSLRSITTGKTLPESSHALVLKRWPTLMYNHYLNHGKENDEWINILETLKDIINSVQPLKTRQDLETLQDTRDNLIKTTLVYLNRTNQSKKDIESVIQGLIYIHQHHIDNADFTEEEIEPVRENEVEVATQEEQPPEEIQPTAPDVEVKEEKSTRPRLPSNIMPGMWFQIYIGEDRALRRGKLSVIIVQDSKLVFVNYQGGIIVEKSFEDFTNELEQGKSKIIMGHSAFDHALSRVVTNLNTKH